FMANSGLAEFPRVDEPALRKGMYVIARLPGMRLALHAEDEALTAKLSRQQKEIGDLSSTAFLNSRPIEAELLAIRMAIDIAGETGCPIHIVHVSCAEGISLISEAKQAGLDVTVETCPHYLSLTSDILESVGAVAKCAPPLRNTSTVEELKEKVRTGEIDTIGSDHSPCPESLKTGSDFFKAWGGISSLQHATPITYSLLHKQLEMPLSSVAILTSQKPAQRFNLSEKGSLSVGMDADICIADFNNKEPVSKESLFYKNPHSPYLGTTSPFRVLRTLVRGQTVYNGGQFLDDFRGRFVRPNR
ncbi:MAG: amidohydrolase family protein, partial [Verrucomicrobia bacterium]|nr:amidohydrolase family protein [Verrucomicrobiota bacterium]